MNVLLTSVGRRSYLVKYFQEALNGQGLVIATNSHSDAAGMDSADRAIIVVPSYHPDYVNTIIRICREFDIRLLCSFHDLDILALARAQALLQEFGVIAMLPDEDWAKTCLDKFECGKRLQREGFPIPWSSVSLTETKCALRNREVRFPLIIKARLGFGSVGLNLCNDYEELNTLYESTQSDISDNLLNRFYQIPSESSILIQESLEGPEICLDIVNDLNGRYASHFISEVHEMRAGESDRATTINPKTLNDMPQRISKLTGHLGIWGIDLLMNNGQPKIIDVNPRFTGDYPFQHIAGANVPAALVAWTQGATPDPTWLNPAVGIDGYKDIVPRLRKHTGKTEIYSSNE